MRRCLDNLINAQTLATVRMQICDKIFAEDTRMHIYDSRWELRHVRIFPEYASARVQDIQMCGFPGFP